MAGAPRERLPPIAEYAFLSDCEVSTLVAPDGSVEWLCLPRPDSPSVFGALLDRSAGCVPVRAGERRPCRTSGATCRAPSVVETTWHTPTGWVTVHDLLVIADSDRGDEA